MKYINTALLIVLIFAVSANFYFDKKRQKEIEKLQNDVIGLEEATSPFSQPTDMYFKAKEESLGPITTISYDRKEHNFGTIKAGNIYRTEFYITNTGNEDLLISKAEGSCGCTVPEFDTKPIKKGEKTTLKVAFDTNGKLGSQLKTVTVLTNTEPSKTIFTIKANIVN